MTDKLWHVARIATGRESSLSQRLSDIGVETFCPMVNGKHGKRRRDGTREAKRSPALPGYLPVEKTSLRASDAFEMLERESGFYDFLRDVTSEILSMADECLEPLRMIDGAPVVYTSGPVFHFGETVKVPRHDRVPMAFWGMVGRVVGVRRGRYCLALREEKGNRLLETWFDGRQLLKDAG